MKFNWIDIYIAALIITGVTFIGIGIYWGCSHHTHWIDGAIGGGIAGLGVANIIEVVRRGGDTYERNI